MGGPGVPCGVSDCVPHPVVYMGKALEAEKTKAGSSELCPT
jgi:hypothetical protein